MTTGCRGDSGIRCGCGVVTGAGCGSVAAGPDPFEFGGEAGPLAVGCDPGEVCGWLSAATSCRSAVSKAARSWMNFESCSSTASSAARCCRVNLDVSMSLPATISLTLVCAGPPTIHSLNCIRMSFRPDSDRARWAATVAWLPAERCSAWTCATRVGPSVRSRLCPDSGPRSSVGVRPSRSRVTKVSGRSDARRLPGPRCPRPARHAARATGDQEPARTSTRMVHQANLSARLRCAQASS